MKRQMNVTVTHVQVFRSKRLRLHKIHVSFDRLPTDFGLNGQRLNGAMPFFYLDKVQGWKIGMKPKHFKAFGKGGIKTGTRLRCTVDDSLPYGIITNVRPRPRKIQTKLKRKLVKRLLIQL